MSKRTVNLAPSKGGGGSQQRKFYRYSFFFCFLGGRMDINEYVNSLIQLTKDHTIIISEKELQPQHVNDFDGIICEGQLQKREFFYLSPPCYYNNKKVIAIMMSENGIISPFFEGDEENFRVTMYYSLLSYAIVKSFTIYQIYIDRFVNDDRYNYILTTDDNVYTVVQLYAKLGGKLSENMFMLFSTPLVVIKLPYIDALPKYSALYVEGDNIHIETINDNILKQVLYKNYENAKNTLQRVLEENPQLTQLIEKLEVY